MFFQNDCVRGFGSSVRRQHGVPDDDVGRADVRGRDRDRGLIAAPCAPGASGVEQKVSSASSTNSAPPSDVVTFCISSSGDVAVSSSCAVSVTSPAAKTCGIADDPAVLGQDRFAARARRLSVRAWRVRPDRLGQVAEGVERFDFDHVAQVVPARNVAAENPPGRTVVAVTRFQIASSNSWACVIDQCSVAVVLRPEPVRVVDLYDRGSRTKLSVFVDVPSFRVDALNRTGRSRL